MSQKTRLGASRSFGVRDPATVRHNLESIDEGPVEHTESSHGTWGKVLKEGWGTKESGQTFLGQHNWKYRLFVLWQKGHRIVWAYYKDKGSEPKGQILLTKEYIARELEVGIKARPHIFSLGPVLDTCAIRTYFVSCKSEHEKISWILMINSAIEGSPEKAMKRESTYRMNKVERVQSFPSMQTSSMETTVLQHRWRMEQWCELFRLANVAEWRRTESKDGVTISRETFHKTSFVLAKVEGVVPVPMQTVYEFLQTSLKSGGKLDFVFRKETLLRKIEEHHTTTYLTQCVYEVPIPGMNPRDVTLMRMWVPKFLVGGKTCGLVTSTFYHPQASSQKEELRVRLKPSGIVLRHVEGADGSAETLVTCIVNIDVRDALQSMMRGAFKSGLIFLGIRNSFSTFCELVVNYQQLFTV